MKKLNYKRYLLGGNIHALIIMFIILLKFDAFAQPYYFVESNNQTLHQKSNEIYSSGWIIVPDTSDVFSETLLINYFDDFGLSINDSLALTRSFQDSLSMTEIYTQFFRNVRVEGGVLYVHSVDGFVFALHGKLIDSLNISTLPSINTEEALGIALDSINADIYDWEVDSTEFLPIPELILAHIPETAIFRDNYLLCYKVTINSVEPYISTNVYVNAQSGEIEFRKSNTWECNGEEGSGTTNIYGDQDLSIRHRWFQDDFILESCDMDYHTRDFNGDGGGWNSGDNITDNDGQFEFNPNTQEAKAVTAHWSAGVTHNIYKNVFGLEGMGGNYNGLRIYLDHDTEDGTPRFEGDHKVKRIFIGGIDELNTLDVLAHEWTHGVIEANSSGLGFEGESGALNESFADVFGKIVEYRESTSWTLNGYSHTANPGVDFSWEMAKAGGTPARSLSNPQDFHQPSEYGGTFWCNSNCEEHQNSGVQNHWFYLLSEGLDNNEHLTGISIESASKIAYRNMVNYIHDGSDYQDSRLGSIQATREIFGRCSEEDYQNQLAWQEVNLGQAVWCASIQGSRRICLDGENLLLASYKVNTLEGASITWFNLDHSWTYHISGPDAQYLTITDLGDAEEFECVTIGAAVTYGGVTKYAYFKICFENCYIEELVSSNNKIEASSEEKELIEPTESSNNDDHVRPVINVFPNPSQGDFYIESHQNTTQTLYIFDLVGNTKLIKNIYQGLNEITGLDLNNAIYFLKIVDCDNNILFVNKLFLVK